jgi:hypothetical protein
VPGRAVAILATLPYVGNIVVVSFYGDAHDQRHTQTMLEHLGDRLSRVGKPFLILGDFNSAPSSVAEWASQLGLPARMVATAQPTCVMTSSERMDYCLAHRRLAVLPHAVDTNLEGVAYPHLGVLLSITLPAVDEVVDVLKRPAKFAAADRVYGPLGGGAAHEEAVTRLCAAADKAVPPGATHGMVPTVEAQLDLDALWE